MNDDPAVDAMLVQHPTPKQIDFEAALLEMDPDKDVDGLHPVNMGRLALGMPGPVPCTPAGIEALLAHHGIASPVRRCASSVAAPRSAVPSPCC
jgi:methylenetetrahydrofolate dehydrogenase (NADP+)/methenyltetrahydrofolate cyclohydrolase